MGNNLASVWIWFSTDLITVYGLSALKELNSPVSFFIETAINLLLSATGQNSVL